MGCGAFTAGLATELGGVTAADVDGAAEGAACVAAGAECPRCADDASITALWRLSFGVDARGSLCAFCGTLRRAIAGARPRSGITTTLVPIFTRLYRSITSSFVRRMQPDETRLPIVDGALVP